MMGVNKAATLDNTTEFNNLHNKSKAGGIGLTHLEAAQMSAKVLGAVKHVRAQSKIGNKFLIALKWAQVSAGTSVPFFEDPDAVPHLEGRWIATLHEALDKYFIDTSPPAPTHQDEIDWPHQPSPSDKVWRIWKQSLIDTVCDKQGRLKQLLGKWLYTEGKRWTWRCSQTTLFGRHGDQWVAHAVVTSSRHQITASSSCHVAELPQDTIPVPDVQIDNCNLAYSIPYHLPLLPQRQIQSPQHLVVFSDYVNTLDKWEADLITNCNLQYDTVEIIHILDTIGRLYFVSDGGETDGL
eukprot:15366885-Ditylum_brightwellii.AAC.1